MTKDEAQQLVDQMNLFNPDSGCPFKSACVKYVCPAYMPAFVTENRDAIGQGTGVWLVAESGCKIIKGLEKLSEM